MPFGTNCISFCFVDDDEIFLSLFGNYNIIHHGLKLLGDMDPNMEQVVAQEEPQDQSGAPSPSPSGESSTSGEYSTASSGSDSEMKMIDDMRVALDLLQRQSQILSDEERLAEVRASDLTDGQKKQAEWWIAGNPRYARKKRKNNNKNSLLMTALRRQFEKKNTNNENKK